MQSNEETVRRIAEELTDVVDGELYSDSDGNFVRIPEFKDEGEKDEWFDGHEPVSLSDYFSDIYDAEFRVKGNRHEHRIVGVSLMIAFGGPNIWVDDDRVRLAWWGQSASCPLPQRVTDALLDFAEELYG